MEFEGLIPPAVIISSNTMAVDDELLPLDPAFLDLAYTSFDPYSHQASFPHHQPPDPTYGGGNHHQGLNIGSPGPNLSLPALTQALQNRSAYTTVPV